MFQYGGGKTIGVPLPPYLKLSAEENPTSDDEKVEMAKVPYASAVGSLIYAMVATRPDIAFAVGVVSRYMANPGKKHWEAVKAKDICRWFYGCGLCWSRRLQEVYFWVCVYCHRRSGLLDLQATEVCCIVYYRGRVCCYH